jgi:hypothetical protein
MNFYIYYSENMNKPSHEAAMGRGVHYSRNNKGVKHMKMKRLVAVFLCILLILSNTPITAAEQSTDYNNHWAKETIEKWKEKIQITGYSDKIFSPNKAISRIEFIVFANRVFGFTDLDEISFKDVSVTDWYYDEVRAAIKAGYIRGYDDGTMRPNHSISRQEAAVILARLVKMDALELQESKVNYADSANIGSWCDKEVKAVTTKGYMKGYPDGRFGPLDQITRAEAITVLDRAEKDSRQFITIEKPGIYTFGQYRGEIKITSGEVILKDTKVAGQVSITSTAILENIQLQNVDINGLLAVRSPDTRIIVENCRISELLVETASGCTWVMVGKNSEILRSTLKGSAKLEETDASGKGFEEVLIVGTTKGNEITLIGNFLSVRVAAPNTKLLLAKGKIEGLSVSPEGKDSVIDIPAGTEVGNLLLQAGVDIKGFGNLKIVMILENGVRIEQRPTSVQFGPGITAVIGYGIAKTSSTSSSDDDEGKDPKPVAKDISEQVLNINDTLSLAAPQLAKYANSIVEVACDPNGIVKAVIEGGNTLEITGLSQGTTRVLATAKNSRGRVNVEFTVRVVDESLDAQQVEEVKEWLELTVQKAHGKNQIPIIALPNTHPDYPVEISWSVDNEDYITIEEEEAVIHRRGKDSGEDCGGEEHTAAALAVDEIVLLSSGCEDGDSGEEDSCIDSGGKTAIVHLTAVIKKGIAQDEKTFKINIPWGWGKAITIGDKGSDHDHEEEEKPAPIPRVLPELIMEIGQNPALIPSRILAQYGHHIEDVKFASGDVVSVDFASGDVISIDFTRGDCLEIAPVSIGEAILFITLANDEGETSSFNMNVTVQDEGSITDEMAVEAASRLIYLKLDISGEGPKQENSIKLPETDPYGYETEITWKSDNDEFITIEGNTAVINRRGQLGEGGCEEEHDEAAALSSTLSSAEEGGCGEDHEEEDEGGCGGSDKEESDSGKKTTVHIMASIRRGSEEVTRSFTVNIPWGWGKAITIGK